MLTESQRRMHLDWLLDVTGIPTAAGREDRVIAWIERWIAERSDVELVRDTAGNLLLTIGGRRSSGAAPLYFTAHLDHPAFVVEEIDVGAGADADVIECSFRGGVNPPYFEHAQVDLFPAENAVHTGVIMSLDAEAKPFKRVRVRMESREAAQALQPGDVGRWNFYGERGASPEVVDGMVHTPACDDLAAVAAALAAFDVLRERGGFEHVGVLFTRAEEIGFIGAIVACTEEWLPRDVRLLCLENSRSFAESPIGAGPILRVGDKTSVFSPELTNHIARVMTEHAKTNASFKWQRKLMPGGTCEASVFSAWGYASTCLCLPLGNYHNMADIEAVAAGKRPALVAPEFISVTDYYGLIEMLIVGAEHLGAEEGPAFRPMMEKLITELGWVVKQTEQHVNKSTGQHSKA